MQRARKPKKSGTKKIRDLGIAGEFHHFKLLFFLMIASGPTICLFYSLHIFLSRADANPYSQYYPSTTIYLNQPCGTQKHLYFFLENPCLATNVEKHNFSQIPLNCFCTTISDTHPKKIEKKSIDKKSVRLRWDRAFQL